MSINNLWLWPTCGHANEGYCDSKWMIQSKSSLKTNNIMHDVARYRQCCYIWCLYLYNVNHHFDDSSMLCGCSESVFSTKHRQGLASHPAAMTSQRATGPLKSFHLQPLISGFPTSSLKSLPWIKGMSWYPSISSSIPLSPRWRMRRRCLLLAGGKPTWVELKRVSDGGGLGEERSRR